jgi:hypothetical protein
MIFSSSKDTSHFVKSTINFNNNFRNPKIDSFNPYGASDAKSGLIIGAMEAFLDPSLMQRNR